ncbi:porin family protein [Luteibaculum oceani]|uniref:Uncharacterized protein n=1 Tax=Luteibaculum oceani TaxID=1294296 RepID=A0A5C6UPM0_9FLAO|nr:hypothetical protein [Luteibaculum oceani]TXC75252.1 hypothetical protein FRX97_11980 [Luteibaculum oceani]
MKWLLSIAILLSSCFLFGQSEWKLRGSAEFQSDLYSFKSNSSELNGRRPDALNRFIFNSHLSNGKGWEIPAFLILPFNQTTTLYPQQANSNYLYDPANIIRISPRYKWMQLHLGRIFPQFSELTIGNIGVFGYHVSLRPGKFVLEYASGVSQQEILPDSTLNFFGLYKRKISALKLGVGDEYANFFHLNVSRSEDVVGNLTRLESSPTPEQGLTIAPSFGFKLFKKAHWKNEVALGIYTRNSLDEDSFNDDIKIPEDLIVINSTSTVDFAASSALRIEGKTQSLALRAKYIGPGFRALGYPFLQSDRMDFTINPSFRWWDNKVIFNGSYGYRINNLLETKAVKTTQALVSTNLFAQINSQFSLGLSFSNFGIESDLSSDSLKIRNISNTISINPSYLFNTKKWQYQISAGYSINAFEEYNAVSASTQTQANTSGQLMWFGGAKGSDFSYDLGLTYFKNNHQMAGIEMFGYQLGAGYKFLERKLRINASVNPLISNRVGFSKDNRLGAKIKADYRLDKIKTRLKLSVSRNNYEYGSVRAGVYFTEWLYRISLAKTF